MTVVALLPPNAKFRGYDNNGQPLAGGKLYTYAAGTTTPIPTYTDSTAGTTNTNPVILNSRGEANVWALPNVAYKFNLQDSLGNTIWTVDQIVNSQLITLYGGVDTGIANAYILNFTAPFTTLVNGIVIYWIPAHTNTLSSTVNVNGLGTVNLVNPDGSALSAGQVTANQPLQMMYYNGNWILLNGTFVSNSFVSGSLNVNGNVALGGAGKTLQGWGQTAGILLDISPDKGSWTTTLSGPYTVNPSGTLKWERQGTQVTIWCDTSIIGTATGVANISASGLPVEITPTSIRQVICSELSDNGITLAGSATVNTSNAIAIQLLTLQGGTYINPLGAFSGSGNTGINAGWSITYSL